MARRWKRFVDRCKACNKPYTNKKTRMKSKHHIYPRRFFPNCDETIELCRLCHSELEREIPAKKQLKKESYRNILENFIRRKNKYI